MFQLQDPDWWQCVPAMGGRLVTVREVEAADADSLYELLTDPKVAAYLSPPPPSVRAFAGFITWAQQQREAGSCVCLGVVPKGLRQAIGLFQVRALEPTFKTAEWGFAIGAPFWSTGIFEDAALLVAQFAFGSIGVHRLEARAVVENGRGNRALEKIGARGEATLRKSFNREHSQFLWSMVADDWKPPADPPPGRFDAAKLELEIARAVAKEAASRRPHDADPPPYPFFLTDSTDPTKEDN